MDIHIECQMYDNVYTPLLLTVHFTLHVSYTLRY